MEEQKKGPVCVTGGTGYIASWLVMRLLQKGYTVRTTVRPDPECKRDISYLTSLPRASENLQILNADLDNPDSFNAAIEGCIGVFHLAHPMPHKEALDEESVTRKAVEGTLGILKACVNSKTVKRVVHTSGSSAAAFSGSNQDIVDESAWSDVEFHRSLKVYGTSHVAAKTKTEQAALQFAEENGLEIVTLVPPLVVGGFITKSIPGSVYLALSMILGKDHYTHLFSSSMVHVDDLVGAHIFLFENPNAKGRYICSSDQISVEELSQFLSAKYPDFQIPTIESLKGIEGYKRCGFSSQKLISSGFKFKHGLDDMFDDAIQSCKEKGFL